MSMYDAAATSVALQQPLLGWQPVWQQSATAAPHMSVVHCCACSYVTPTERQVALSSSLRSAKEAAVQQQASLVQKYGPAGAAAMRQILDMPVPDRPAVAIKASREDLAAVQELPPLGLAEP
jgi:hypothetical protein